MVGEVIDEVISGERTHSGLSVHGVSEFDLGEAFDELGPEGLVVVLVDDEPLGREADLTSVGASTSQSRKHGLVDIPIIKHDQSVVSSEFHHSSLQVLPSLLGNQRPALRRASEADPANRIPLEDLVDLIMTSVHILIFPVIEASLDHALLNDPPDSRAGIRIPRQDDIPEEQVGQPSFEV